MKDIEKIKTLIDEINFHNYQYHGMDDPKISDHDFDQMVRALHDLEKIILNSFKLILRHKELDQNPSIVLFKLTI